MVITNFYGVRVVLLLFVRTLCKGLHVCSKTVSPSGAAWESARKQSRTTSCSRSPDNTKKGVGLRIAKLRINACPDLRRFEDSCESLTSRLQEGTLTALQLFQYSNCLRNQPLTETPPIFKRQRCTFLGVKYK